MSDPQPDTLLTDRELNEQDPIQLFEAWFELAQQSELNDPNAMALATCTPDGYPSVRMVLNKPTAGHAFCFYTNAESQKGVQLAMNPRAALCFHWKSLRRQVRVEGTITELGPDDVDAYFHSRGRRSQIGAAVSSQSRPLASREVLEERARVFAAEHTGEIPRPDYWRGYHVHPARIEFWNDGPDRLHDRFLFIRAGETELWEKSRLYP